MAYTPDRRGVRGTKARGAIAGLGSYILRRRAPFRRPLCKSRLSQFIGPPLGGKPPSGAGGFAPFLGAIACGLGIGAEIDLMAFFTSRYFGLRDYTKLYGTMFGIFALGVGIGPALSGASFDRFHSYTPAFVIFVIMLAVGCAVFLRLGPSPYAAPSHA